MDKFSDAAGQEQPDGQEPVAPAFNKAAIEAPAEKDAMTAEAAAAQTSPQEPALFETERMIAPRENLSDEAFAAIKRGDALRLKALLDDGLDVNTRDEQGYTLLMRATQEGATDMARDLLIREADPCARADAGLTALMLAATNGNVEIAQLLLDEIEDSEMDNEDDEVAEELALEHGNMSVYLAIQARKRRSEFNKAALDANDHERAPASESRAAAHEGAVMGFVHNTASSIGETIRKDAHIVAEAFSHSCHAAIAFCSSFFHHHKPSAPSDPAADAEAISAEVEKMATPTVSLLSRLLHLDQTNNKR